MSEGQALLTELREAARDLAEREFQPRAAEVDRTEAYPWACVEKLAAAGFMGMTIPTQYGGGGHSYRAAVTVIEEMARCCGTMGRSPRACRADTKARGRVRPVTCPCRTNSGWPLRGP